jgi:UDP-N-acetylmuramoyl-L-alanyl-D-glutamate--2,6-diaminopimelate ligase
MRVAGLCYKAAVFTNLTQDHLDYHGTMQVYEEAKHMLFAQTELGITNLDDEAGPRMLIGNSARSVTYSAKKDAANYTAKNIELKANGVQYELVSKTGIGRIQFAVPGAFSVYNSMAAAVTALEMGLPMATVTQALANSHGVTGRMEVVPTNTDFTVIIDYAHSPDGLENVLRALRETAFGRLITVFGCGGDRDATKRPIMGEIAEKGSDIVIVTSDNPRSEDPNAIIDEILAGIRNKARVHVEPDRIQAVGLALKLARAGDTVLLAGKGQETYQVLASGKIHLDEREIVRDILAVKTAVQSV